MTNGGSVSHHELAIAACRAAPWYTERGLREEPMSDVDRRCLLSGVAMLPGIVAAGPAAAETWRDEPLARR
jgi:hypothetical protein